MTVHECKVNVLFCRSFRESAMLRCLEESIKAILDSDMKIKGILWFSLVILNSVLCHIIVILCKEGV